MSENFDPKNVKLSKYEKEFTEDGLWEKIGSVAKKAGKGVIKNALKLYYAMVLGKATPSQIASIIGALGYLFKPHNQFKYFSVWSIIFTLICFINSVYYFFLLV